MTPPQAERVQRLAALLQETGRAHHQAYSRTNGEDPEWPLWYAAYLLERIGPLFATPFTKSELVYLLAAAEREQAARDPGADWADFYARFFLTRHK